MAQERQDSLQPALPGRRSRLVDKHLNHPYQTPRDFMHVRTSTTTTILIIDDETSAIDDVAHALRLTDYACQWATTAAEAMDCVKRGVPDLVISDIDLAGNSGLELCERLRELPGMDEVPVIFVSGAQIPNIVRQARSAGGVYFLRKPFDPEVLIELVDKALWMPHLLRRQLQLS